MTVNQLYQGVPLHAWFHNYCCQVLPYYPLPATLYWAAPYQEEKYLQTLSALHTSTCLHIYLISFPMCQVYHTKSDLGGVECNAPHSTWTSNCPLLAVLTVVSISCLASKTVWEVTHSYTLRGADFMIRIQLLHVFIHFITVQVPTDSCSPASAH